MVRIKDVILLSTGDENYQIASDKLNINEKCLQEKIHPMKIKGRINQKTYLALSQLEKSYFISSSVKCC